MSGDHVPVGSSEPGRLTSPSHGSGSNLPTTSNENLSSRTRRAARSYITKQRLAEITQRLSARDHDLLIEVQRLRLVSGQQLRRLLYEDTEAGRRLARQDLKRLTKWRVMGRLERRVGGIKAGSEGYIYRLDVLGQRIVEGSRARYRSPWTPGTMFVSHALDLSEVYVRLQERAVRDDFSVLRFDAEPKAWRVFNGPGGRRLTLKPDAFVIVLSGDYEGRFFIEIDRGTESVSRITAKAKLYVAHWQSGREQETQGIYPQVLWIAPDERRRSQLLDGMGAIDPDHWRLFAAVTSDQAVGSIAADENSR